MAIDLLKCVNISAYTLGIMDSNSGHMYTESLQTESADRSCSVHASADIDREAEVLTSSFVFLDDGVCCLEELFLGGAMSGSVTTPSFCSGESCWSLMADSSFLLSGRRLKWH